jgi:hypothetical protein
MSFVDFASTSRRLKQDGKPGCRKLARARSRPGLIAAHAAGVHRDLAGQHHDWRRRRSADHGLRHRAFQWHRLKADTYSPGPFPLTAADAATDGPGAANDGIVGTIGAWRLSKRRAALSINVPTSIRSALIVRRGPRPQTCRTRRELVSRRAVRASNRRAAGAHIDATIPEPFDVLISRCLDPDPAKRYQTAGELEADLDRLDDEGGLIPVKRVVGVKMLAAVVTLAVALVGGSLWYARTIAPEKPHDPVSVLIADVQNRTGDAALDRTLEPMFERAL